MKNSKLQILFSFLALFIVTLTVNAQSISGSISDFSSTNSLGYANVDIYKGTKLVASVLADKDGNFNVKLDTGLYKAEIIYAGYKKIVQEIRVTNDEKVNFGLKGDKESRYKVKDGKAGKPSSKDISPAIYGTFEKEDDFLRDFNSFRDSDYDDAEVVEEIVGRGEADISDFASGSKRSIGIVAGDYPGGNEQGVAGRLTAGEINDFSKWNLWTDLKNEELSKYKSQWNFSPEQRYMVQLIDQRGLPLADVSVHLLDKSGVRFYSARTDNTGKAELWKSLLFSQKVQSTKMSIEVLFNGKKHIIKKALPLDKGLNTLKLTTECNQSQRVDIAFVVDATGSMSDELNFLKAELNDVMFKSKEISSSLNFRFANVFYRDHSDAYLTRTQDFTRVLSESVSFISDQYAGGGGDFEEAVEVALDTAINNLSWSDYARTRIVFLILDAPPHNTPEIQEKLNRISKQAAEKGIRIVPLVASGINKGTEYLMRSIALATNGTYAFLTDHSGVGGSHLKPSTDSYEVETLNELLVRVIKSYSYMPDCDQNLPELDLNYPTDTVVYTSVDTIITDTSSSNNTLEPQVSWSYYPNPTRGIVNIRASVLIPELYVTDLSGKVLQVIKNIQPETKVQADLSGYASGIYLIRYPIGKKWVSGKVVLIRN
ncbi:MAG: hypothetical protein COA58_12560 [Bacteroidetes bacterium]|nr:MAG: hypothetical protein COA58_12560 [Bacteroidota bacterium]